MHVRLFRALAVFVLCHRLAACAIYHREPFHIKIVDGETREPIGGASVTAMYLYGMVTIGPDTDHWATDSDGLIRERVAIGKNVYARWEARHPDFIAAKGDVRLEPESREWLRPYAEVRPGEDRLNVIPLYRKPIPEMRVILPDEYRGPVYVDLQRGESALPTEPGRRVFEFEAASNGYVRVVGPPLFDLAGSNWSDSMPTGGLTNWQFYYQSMPDHTPIPAGERGWPVPRHNLTEDESREQQRRAASLRAHLISYSFPRKLWFIGTNQELKTYLRTVAFVDEERGVYSAPTYDAIRGMMIEAARGAGER